MQGEAGGGQGHGHRRARGGLRHHAVAVAAVACGERQAAQLDMAGGRAVKTNTARGRTPTLVLHPSSGAKRDGITHGGQQERIGLQAAGMGRAALPATGAGETRQKVGKMPPALPEMPLLGMVQAWQRTQRPRWRCLRRQAKRSLRTCLHQQMRTVHSSPLAIESLHRRPHPALVTSFPRLLKIQCWQRQPSVVGCWILLVWLLRGGRSSVHWRPSLEMPVAFGWLTTAAHSGVLAASGTSRHCQDT
mmetsp:Transcript_53468/g.95109  ORF Transcript_53468/g.95109 Transcript_53468/m.95109 type:complete len:247 (-) Transcript_53468:820-1560(-)